MKRNINNVIGSLKGIILLILRFPPTIYILRMICIWYILHIWYIYYASISIIWEKWSRSRKTMDICSSVFHRAERTRHPSNPPFHSTCVHPFFGQTMYSGAGSSLWAGHNGSRVASRGDISDVGQGVFWVIMIFFLLYI